MILHNVSDLYEKVASKTGLSSSEVKRCIMDVFRVVKELTSTYPEKSAILLNRLCNIEVKSGSVKNLLQRRLMSDEHREKWIAVYDSTVEYHRTKKIKNKKNDEEIVCNGGLDTTLGQDNWVEPEDSGSES